MDYMLGEWEVREGGAVTGFARFSKAAMECAIVEDWAGSNGSAAKAVLFYNPRVQVWQIISVSPGGVLDAREQEPGLFLSAATKRRYIKEATGWALEETAGGQTRRRVYRKSTSPPVAVPATSRCEAPEYRDFDFWVGEWEVVVPRGERAGSDSVQKAANGCVLVENWTGVKLNTAISLNFWDPQRRVWRQAWVGPTGLLEFEGWWKDGAIRLEGNTSPTHSTPGAVASDGTEQMNRIAFTPLADGSVYENWERSTDGGKTWRGSFIATYRRVQ